MTIKQVVVRGMDTAVWQRVKVAAIKKNKTIVAWLMEAIRVKLRKENG